MAKETHEERVRRVKDKFLPIWHNAVPDNSLLSFAIEWDAEHEEHFRSGNWGFFRAEKPRHLDHKTREFLVTAILSFRDREGAYQHAKNALELGATLNQLIEVVSIGQMPGGGPTRQAGLDFLRRIAKELDLKDPIDRPDPRPFEEPDPASMESREDRVKRITERIFEDLGYEDPNIAFGVQLDPDYFEVYSKIYWGFWESRECHLDPITRELVLVVLMSFRGLREELYQHCKKALRLGATMEQLLECFEVCVAPAGIGQLHLGLEALRTIHEEKDG